MYAMDTETDPAAAAEPSPFPLRAGIALLLITVLLSALSFRFEPSVSPARPLVLRLIAIELCAGIVYLLIVLRLLRSSPGAAAPLDRILLLGILMRIVLLPSVPMLEDDFHRYLWDGAVAARGINPYRYAPREVLEGAPGVPAELLRLGEESPETLRRINHPEIRTIYPPVAQAAFALAHWMTPWSTTAWRCVLFAADLAAFFLLAALLGRLGLPLGWIVVYWWNPLLLREIYNACHMDVMVLPFVAGAFLAAARGRGTAATASLAAASGTKLWPILLLPLLLRPLLHRPRRAAAALGIFAAAGLLLFLPIASGGLDGTSGFLAYPTAWQNNAAVFPLTVRICESLLRVLGQPVWNAQRTARWATAAMIFGLVLWKSLPPLRDEVDRCRRALWILAGVFLLGPTAFPWYFLWMLPFLAAVPSVALITLGVLLSFYDARFLIDPGGSGAPPGTALVLAQFVPFYALLVLEAWRRRRRRPSHA